MWVSRLRVRAETPNTDTKMTVQWKKYRKQKGRGGGRGEVGCHRNTQKENVVGGGGGVEIIESKCWNTLRREK